MSDPPKQTDQALHEQRERLRVTLSRIGGGVIATDSNGGVTFVNPAAQPLTGWTQEDAAGKPLDAVFQIVNEESRRTSENPAFRALRESLIVGLANHTLVEQVRDYARVQGCLAHSLPFLGRDGSAPSVAFSLTPTVE